MVHSLPDYTSKVLTTKIYGNIDLGELAARLGSPSLLDRRGNIVWWDDFESPNAVHFYINGSAGGTGAISQDRAFMGDYSMKIVTDGDDDDYMEIQKALTLPTSHSMGLETMFYIHGGKPCITLQMLGYSGTDLYLARFKYDYNTDKIYYEDSGLNDVELTKNDNTTVAYESWFYMKMVIDFDIEEYVRLIFGSTEYDMTGIPMYTAVNATDTRILFLIKIQNQTAAASTVYLDNVIFTQNE